MTDAQRAGLRRLVRSFYDMQRLRMQSAGRSDTTKAGKAKKRPVPVELDADTKAVIDRMSDGLLTLEESLLAEIAPRVKAQEVGKWLLNIRGVGPTMAGVIMAEVDIRRAETVSALWRFSGLAVVAGRRERRRKGEKSPYNGFLKSKMAYVLPSSILKACVSSGPKSGWIEAAWESSSYSEKLSIDAVSTEQPGEQERAAVWEQPGGPERADLREQPVLGERALPLEQPAGRECAEASEQPVETERAVVGEQPKTGERAAGTEQPNESERADPCEQPNPRERAEQREQPEVHERLLVRRWVTGYAKVYADYRWRLLHRVGPCAACADEREQPILTERAGKGETTVDPKRASCPNCMGTGRGPWGKSSAHRHQAACSYLSKILLKDLWLAWRAMEGLPVREPYAVEKLGLRMHG